MITNQYFT